MIDFVMKGRGFKPLNLNWWPQTQTQWSKVLLKENQTFWKKEEDPSTGQPWKRLTPGYRTWKQGVAGGKPILQLTGRMQKTAKIVPFGSGLQVQTTSYGPYHQFGTGKMAARPWMGVPRTSIQQLSTLAWKNILR